MHHAGLTKSAIAGQRAPDGLLTTAVDGGLVKLSNVFAAHALTVLLFDGAVPTSEGYKTLVGLALDLAARWGDQVASYIVTMRNDRPFEIPCAVGILFDDRSELEAGYSGERERAYVVDSRGLVTLRLEPADASAVLAHVAATLEG